MTDELQTSAKSTSVNWEDRRSSPRHKTDIAITWHLVAKQSIIREGRLVDLSVAGAAIRTSESLPLESYVSIKLPPKRQAAQAVQAAKTAQALASPPPSAHSLSVKGKIVNAQQLDNGDWRYGLKFDRLYYTLAEWLSHELSHAPSPETSPDSVD